MSNAVLENRPAVPEEIPTFTATLVIRRFDPEVLLGAEAFKRLQESLRKPQLNGHDAWGAGR